MTPNWEAFQASIRVLLMATPFMFGVLTLFAVIILALSYVQDPKEK